MASNILLGTQINLMKRGAGEKENEIHVAAVLLSSRKDPGVRHTQERNGIHIATRKEVY